jgi:TPR repeat protein
MKHFGRHLLAASAAIALGAPALSTAAQAQAQSANEAAMRAGIDAWDQGDFAGAVRQWRPLADKGDADAQFNLGQAYKQGKGVPADLSTALSWYEKAAKRGHPQAQVNVGLLLYNGGRKAEALPWLRKGADLDDPRAQYIIGTEMFNGQLVSRDWPRAYALMTLASGRGLAAAVQNLKAMDEYIPAAQRQQGLAIAKRMEAGTEKLAGPAPRVAGNAPSDDADNRPPARRTPPVQTAERAPAPTRPASARPAAASPAPPSAGGRWRVQLGAFADGAGAQRQWSALKAKVPALARLQSFTVKAGAVTRLQAGPLASREDAARVCSAAQAAGTGCFPVAP